MFNHMSEYNNIYDLLHYIFMKCHMKPRGRERGEDIDRAILEYLAEQDWPATTEMVAKKLGVLWNTAQTHLYKLMVEDTS